MPSIRIVLVLLALCPVVAMAEPDGSLPELVYPAHFSIPPGHTEATTEVYFRNKSDTKITGQLRLSDFVQGEQVIGLPATVSFHRAANLEQPLDVLEIEPGKIEQVLVRVSELPSGGRSKAQFLLDGREFGPLAAMNHLAPYSVSLKLPEAAGSRIEFRAGEATPLRLVSSEPLPYPVHWWLSVGGAEQSGIAVLNAPGNSSTILVDPPRSDPESLIKPKDVRARLILGFTAHTPDPDASAKRRVPAPVPKRDPIDFDARILPPDTVTAALALNGVIFLALLAGGSFSLMMNHWIPNQLKRVDARKRLDALARKIGDIKPTIGSELRVQLRVERNRIAHALDRLFLLSPHAKTGFSECGQRLSTLEQRTKLVLKVGLLLARLDESDGANSPYTLVERALADIREIIPILKAEAPSAEDLAEAASAIEVVEGRIASMGQKDDEFASLLFERFKKLRENHSGKFQNSEEYQKLNLSLPGPARKLVSWTFQDSESILPADYYEIDFETNRLDVIQTLAETYAETTNSDRKKIINESIPLLREELEILTNTGLRNAVGFLREIRENTLARDLATMIGKGDVPQIEPASPTVKAGKPMVFRAAFPADRLNQCAARKKIKCVWDFGDGLPEEDGWEVHHYFQKKGSYTVTVRFRAVDGAFIFRDRKEGDPVKPVECTSISKIEVKRDGSRIPWPAERTRIEMLNMGVTLAAALLALVAGAKEQLLGMSLGGGLTAIFLLGFSADTVKNLMTQSGGSADPADQGADGAAHS